MRYLLPLLLITLFTPQGEAAEAVIEGQTKVKAGVQFVLDASKSEGEFSQWITDPRILALPDEERPTPFICNKQYALSLVTPGTYFFVYTTSDAEGLDSAIHQVEVSPWDQSPFPVPDQPDQPDEPDEPAPEPKPEPSFKLVKEASDKQVAAINDPVTANRLSIALAAITPQETVERTADLARQATETVLLTRDDAQRGYPWINWRNAVNTEINKLTLTPESYVSVLKVLSDSLKSTPAPSASKIIPYCPTGNCPNGPTIR